MIVGATLSTEAALAVRRVGAFHQANGEVEVPELEGLWLECERRLAEARHCGDEVSGRAALAAYETKAIAAIRRAAT